MIAEDQLSDIPGATVYGSDGEKIGKVAHVFLDDLTGRGEWMTVATGLFGVFASFVPLACATLVEGRVEVPFDKSKIKDAPKVAADDHLDAVEEDALYRYYELEDARPEPDEGGDHVPRDFAGDPLMTPAAERSGEGAELRPDPYVVAEKKTVTVTISAQEIRIEEDVLVQRLPATEAVGVAAAQAGGDDTTPDHVATISPGRPGTPDIVAATSREFIRSTQMPVGDALDTLERVLQEAQASQTAEQGADEDADAGVAGRLEPRGE